jgi:hypothetical protein
MVPEKQLEPVKYKDWEVWIKMLRTPLMGNGLEDLAIAQSKD